MCPHKLYEECNVEYERVGKSYEVLINERYFSTSHSDLYMFCYWLPFHKYEKWWILKYLYKRLIKNINNVQITFFF